MPNFEKIQNFIFRGLLLDSSLGIFADSGLDVRGNVKEKKQKDNRISIDDFPMDLRMNAVETSQVYIAFFCFENSVRKLVSERLLERKGAKWWNSISQKIKTRVKDRMDKDKKNKWHAPRAKNEISYCDFKDLNDIILSNWSEFEDLFPTQEWVKTRLGDLEPSRNALAHSNVLSDHDIDRIDMFLRDWVLQVG